MKKSVAVLSLAFWVLGGLLLMPGFSFAQVLPPGVQIFDDDVNGIRATLSGSTLSSNLVITQESTASPGSVIWDFTYITGVTGTTTYSYNIYELGTNLTNPPASALSDTLLLTRTGGGPAPASGHLEFFSGPLNDTPLLIPLSSATAINETGSLQTPPNGPSTLDLSTFQFQSDLDASSVPEPLSLFLFGAGLVGMAVIGRKDHIVNSFSKEQRRQ